MKRTPPLLQRLFHLAVLVCLVLLFCQTANAEDNNLKITTDDQARRMFTSSITSNGFTDYYSHFLSFERMRNGSGTSPAINRCLKGRTESAPAVYLSLSKEGIVVSAFCPETNDIGRCLEDAYRGQSYPEPPFTPIVVKVSPPSPLVWH